MALSNYERRVLEEFETEFHAAEGRRGRVRSALHRTSMACLTARATVRRRWTPLSVALSWIAVCAAVIVLVPVPAAAIITALAGAAAGCLVTRTWRTSGSPRRRRQ